MEQSPYRPSSARFAFDELREWISENSKASAFAAMAALVALPLVHLLSGGSLKDQIIEIVGYSLIGPFVLIGITFVVFWIRAPSKIHRKHVSELIDLRTKLSLPIDDLVEKKISPKKQADRKLIFALCLGAVGATGLSYEDQKIDNESHRATANLKRLLNTTDGTADGIIKAARIVTDQNKALRGLTTILCATDSRPACASFRKTKHLPTANLPSPKPPAPLEGK